MSNLLMNAIKSKLVSDRDNVLVQLDIALNKNTNIVSAKVVDNAVSLFRELAILESALETFEFILKSNNNQNSISERIKQLNEVLTNTPEIKSTNDDSNPS